MASTPDLFDADPTFSRGAKRAPQSLNPAEWKALADWAEDHAPWISRGALGSLTPLEEYADTCLCYFRARTTRRAGWVATICNWIRRDERKRLERSARAGDESARLALTNPREWRRRYDAKQAASRRSIPLQPIEPLPQAAARADFRSFTIAARRS